MCARSVGRATILVADDEKNILITLKRALEMEDFRVEVAGGGRLALEKLRATPVDLALVDVQMPDLDGLGLLDELRAAKIEVPVVMMSGHANVEVAVDATRRGAVDFLEKPIGTEKLLVTVQNALRLHRLEGEQREREAEDAERRTLVGESPPMAQLRTIIAKVAPTNTRVLISGDRGTGKELVARAIHEASRRAERAYIKLNCAAVPAELIESELFGHEKGAFTGATAARRGKFELADEGTLFLDEVGDMPLPMQAKLLRVLQEGELERVGGGETIHVDVRVVAATNQDLAKRVAERKFRADLLDRLNVFPVATPPLRGHKEDIPILVRHAVRQVSADNGMRPKTFSEPAISALMRHDWPGNVRELRNAVERLLILADGDEIGVDEVAIVLPAAPTAQQPRYERGRLFKDLVQSAERDILIQALVAHEWHMSRTAEELGLERSHLYKKLKQLGIERPSSKS